MKSLVFILSLWLAIVPAWADGVAVPGVPHAGQIGAEFSYPPVSAGGYTGPGDIVSGAWAWWGFRCYNAAYTGKVADIVDAATGNTTGTRLQCSAGVVSALVSGSACTFVTGNTCSSLATTCATACNVVTMYDQSGNSNCSAVPCDMTQATNANRPSLTVSCQHAQPCAVFNAASAQTLAFSATAGSLNQPLSMSGVAIRTGANTAFGDFIGSGNGSVQFLFSNAVNTFTMYAGGAVPTGGTATDNVWHALQGVYNGASSNVYIDGTSTATTVGANGIATSLNIGSNNNPLTGKIGEAGIWSVAFTGTQEANLNSNQRAFWGF